MVDIKLTHAGGLKIGSYILIEGNVCQVRDLQTSRPGKHGHAKVRIKAVDLFSGNNKEIIKPGHDSVEVPIIYKKDAQILSIDGDDISMMDNETFETHHSDKKLSEETIRDSLKVGQTIVYWTIGDKYVIKQIRDGME